MARISKYLKLDKNILMEYIYDSGNLQSSEYSILVNSKHKTLSYFTGEASLGSNLKSNQLFKIDTLSRRYGKVNTNYYSFLQERNFPPSTPIEHSTIKIHLPVNWSFGEYLGFYLRVYAYDHTNNFTYDISNFYFDITNISQSEYLNFTAPPFIFQEKMWGKYISVDIPSIHEIANQLENGVPKEHSLNYNLTDGVGLSMTSPVFIDFHFIERKDVINSVESYILGANTSVTVPQTPEFEKLGLMVEHSKLGDYFEIYGVYNQTNAGLRKFIDDAFMQDKHYYIQYDITLYEQNIRGKTTTITVKSDFDESVEYRPIVKYSTTTAIIDVEMRLIDAVDNSSIIRRASYGMLQDELSKYSLNLMKINVDDVHKPKIYNIKTSISGNLIGGLSNKNGNLLIDSRRRSIETPEQQQPAIRTNTRVEVIKVPFPVFIEKNNIIARSENALYSNVNFYGYGNMQIILYPFDNVVRFTIASGDNSQIALMDLTGYEEVTFVIKNDSNSLIFPLYNQSEDNNLQQGQVSFKIDMNKVSEIKRIYESGINLFYIVGKSEDVTNVIYTGLFKIYDNRNNVLDLNAQATYSAVTNSGDIITDPNIQKETAIITRKLVSDNEPTPKNKQ